jgi:hypothetical protein
VLVLLLLVLVLVQTVKRVSSNRDVRVLGVLCPFAWHACCHPCTWVSCYLCTPHPLERLPLQRPCVLTIYRLFAMYQLFALS